MSKWISFPRSEGVVSRQAHVKLPEGTYEREFGKEGFFGPATQIYHRHPPTNWSRWEGDLRPHAFDLGRITNAVDSPWAAPVLLHNPFVEFRYWRGKSMPRLARNADGDQLIFIHEGMGDLFCDFGHLPVGEGDYVVLPRGTMWRIESKAAFTALLLEATNDSYQLPERGMLGHHALFDPGVLQTPQINERFIAQQDDAEWQVEMKRGALTSTATFPYNPLDAVGWQGDLAPVKLNWRDIRPVVSARYHLPPAAHTTFVSSRFVVCTFAPRPVEQEADVLKVPYYHSNNDYDEILFFHSGKFFSRDQTSAGTLSFNPCGFAHGPHSKAHDLSRSNPKTHHEEVAVMIDTRDALIMTDAARFIDLPDYINSWK